MTLLSNNSSDSLLSTFGTFHLDAWGNMTLGSLAVRAASTSGCPGGRIRFAVVSRAPLLNVSGHGAVVVQCERFEFRGFGLGYG
jgi:hypothetical protein